MEQCVLLLHPSGPRISEASTDVFIPLSFLDVPQSKSVLLSSVFSVFHLHQFTILVPSS